MTRLIGAAAALAIVTTACGNAAHSATRSKAAVSVAEWPTWVIPTARSVNVAAPPQPGSAAATADADASRQAKADDSAEAHELVKRWQEEPATAPWTDLNLDLISGRTGMGDPPRTARGYALVSVAMYDAVVSAAYWQKHYGRDTYPSENAAIAGAASRVLAYLFPARGAASLDQLANDAGRARVASGANVPSDVEAGLDLGRRVAEAVIARGQADGADTAWTGTVPTTAGSWSPPPGTTLAPVEPIAGTWKAWVLKSGDQFRPPPPPAVGSTQFVAEENQLLTLRTNLTPEQKRVAKFWEGGPGTPLPPGVWNQVALAYVRRDHLDTAHAARAFALMNMAMADTGIAVWDAKFAYWGPRPVNAIRDSGLDPTWTPFLDTPPFPGYVSAHSGFSSAASEVLSVLFPRDAGSFRAKAVEAGVSRLSGGIHFKADDIAGHDVGEKVGRLVVQKAGLAP